MSNLTVYMIGYALIVAGLAWGAHMLGAPPKWIMIGALVMAGIGLVSGVGSTRRRESSPNEDD